MAILYQYYMRTVVNCSDTAIVKSSFYYIVLYCCPSQAVYRSVPDAYGEMCKMNLKVQNLKLKKLRSSLKWELAEI